MTRRSALAATASAVAVLMVLAGVRWVLGRPAEPVAQWHATPVVTAPQPTPASPTGSPQPTAIPSPTTPAPTPASPTATSTPSPTKSPSKPPSGPLDLKRTTGTSKVALTFDDGPHPVWTPKILDRLRAADVRATFCLIGTAAQSHPELVVRIVRDGHTLCNHSWHHEFELGTLPEAEIRANLKRTNEAIRRAVPDAQIRYFRHPGGKWTPAAVKVARELGMASLHWDVDPQDWAKPGADVIAQRVITKSRPGSIVLLHDGGGDRDGTLKALSEILPALKRKFGITLLK